MPVHRALEFSASIETFHQIEQNQFVDGKKCTSARLDY